MWQKAGPVATAVLAVGLILTMRRLSDARVELERRRRAADDRRAPDVEGFALRPLDASELAREWEQAAPPMDS
jgi:hypothetical protein